MARPPTINATDATTEHSIGVVQISTVVDFDAGEAAGTGIVLDASATGGGAIVVTNHHVVESATSIEVTDPVTLGYSAFLGVGVSTSGGTATVGNLVVGGPAADAGIGVGSTITTFDGTSLTSAAHLRRLIQQHLPGEAVSVSWTDAQGGGHDATLTLGRAPVA